MSRLPPRQHAYLMRSLAVTNNEHQPSDKRISVWAGQDGNRQRKRNWEREARKIVKEEPTTSLGPQKVDKREGNVSCAVKGPAASEAQTRRFDPRPAATPMLSPESCATILAIFVSDSDAEREVLLEYKQWLENPITQAWNSSDTVPLNFLEGLLQEITQDLEDLEEEIRRSSSPNSMLSLPPISSQTSTKSSPTSSHHSHQTGQRESGCPPTEEAEPFTSDTNSHLVRDFKHQSSSPASQTTKPAMDVNVSIAENELYAQVQQLRYEANLLRKQICSQRMLFGELESGLSQEEQSDLKNFRVHLAEHSQDEYIVMDHKVAFGVHGMISRDHDESGLRLDHLRQSLHEKEERLGELESQLHGHYLGMERRLGQTGARSGSFRHFESRSDGSSLVDREVSKHPSQYLHGWNKDEEAQDSPGSDDWQGEPEPLKIFDPSKYHEDYVKLNDLEGCIKIWEEQLSWLKRRKVKLLDDKERRAGVGLHLSDGNEELLQTLPNQITKLEAELEEGHEELERLMRACLMAGIIDENGEPIEEFVARSQESDDDNDSHGQGEKENIEDDIDGSGPSVAEHDDDLLYPTPGKSYGNPIHQQNALTSPSTIPSPRQTSSEGDQQEQDDHNVVVSVQSENGPRSPVAQSFQNDLLVPPNHASSWTSGPTIFAVSAISRNQSLQGNEEAEVLSVDSWLFEKLQRSQSEVRLLATIVQATGTPLLEKTADLVVQFWNSTYGSDTTIAKMPFDSVASIVFQEGYDMSLVHQIVENDWETVDIFARIENSNEVPSDVKSLPDS